MTIFPDLPDIAIEQVEVTEQITITLHATSFDAPCPNCGTFSARVQSHYTRTLHDLPSSGHAVQLIVHVRRFVCQKRTCSQKIFAEQFPALTLPRAQRTKRLQEALCQLGFALGGQAGTRVGNQLSFSGSRDTILRLVRQSEQPPVLSPRIIGIDDWAWKRSLRYGTLIYDLERQMPLDLLPDRSVETVSAWFQKHPSIEVISRDRASEYAIAARKGAPQAVQVADRWHLTKNLAECLSALLAHCRAEIRRAGHVLVKPNDQRPPLSKGVEQVQQARRAQRQDQYAQVITLHQQGLRRREIARHLEMGERTVERWLAHGSYPEPRRRRKRPSVLDRYEAFVQQRWKQGYHNGVQLWRELTANGYTGSQRAVYRYIATLEPSASLPKKHRVIQPTQPHASTMAPTPLEHFSAKRATWLFLRNPADLNEAEQEELRLIRQASPTAERAYQLVGAFMQILRERTGQQLDSWLKEVETSHLHEFDPFLVGVQRDKAAVLAGLTLSWSNGPLEGNINRLKLIKRSMYGRAKFDLLRQRVLHRAEHAQETPTFITRVN